MKKLKILGITIARGGSKGVPRKNIRPILGIPLIAYTILEAKKSKYLTRYVVCSDDEEIRRVATEYGAEAPFSEPAEIATDTTLSIVPLQYTVNWVEEQEREKYDYIVELMCTNPVKTVDDIDGVIEKLIATGADSVISVVKLEDHHPARIKKIIDDKIVDFCVPELSGRRQDLRPFAYVRNGSIYSMKRDVLMINNIRYGSENSRPYIMPEERTVNIDTLMDLKIAETMIIERKKTGVN